VVVEEVGFEELVGGSRDGRADRGGGGRHGLGVVGDELETSSILLHVGREVLVKFGGNQVPDLGRGALVEAHAPENLNIIVDLEAGVKVKVVLRPVLQHLAVDLRLGVGVDEDKGELDTGLEVDLGLALQVGVSRDQVLERNFLCGTKRERDKVFFYCLKKVQGKREREKVAKANLENESLEMNLLLVNPLNHLPLFVFESDHLMHRVLRQPDPANLLLVLDNDIHRHQDVQRIVHSATNVFLQKTKSIKGKAGLLRRFQEWGDWKKGERTSSSPFWSSEMRTSATSP